jgi:hypothetical protein
MKLSSTSIILLTLILMLAMGACQTSPPSQDTGEVRIDTVFVPTIDTVTVTEVKWREPNYDSALRHYAPYTNLVSDTTQLRGALETVTSLLDESVERSLKLEDRLAQQQAIIRKKDEQLRKCVAIGDTAALNAFRKTLHK